MDEQDRGLKQAAPRVADPAEEQLLRVVAAGLALALAGIYAFAIYKVAGTSTDPAGAGYVGLYVLGSIAVLVLLALPAILLGLAGRFTASLIASGLASVPVLLRFFA
jgi:hypothetical protein